MHRIGTFLLLFCLLHLSTLSQNPLDAWKWFNTCSQASGGYGYNRVWDMCSDANDDLIVAGTYYKEAHFSGNHGTGHWIEAVGKDGWISNEKFFLAKYRESGELAWVRTGIGGHNQGSAVKADQDGNIYCMISCSETIYLESSGGEEIHHSFGRPNGPGTLLVKYSPEGKILWHLVLDVRGVNGRDLDIGPKGEVFLIARSHLNTKKSSLTLPSLSGKDTSLYVYPPIPNRSTSTTMVCKYAPEGELIWAKNFGCDSLALFGNGIAANPKGGFALGLHYSGHGEYAGLDLDSRMGGTHSLILNFDEEGEKIYATQFGKNVYTQHEGGAPKFKFDSAGRLVVATAVDYSPLCFSPAVGDDLLLKGYNQYTCYLLLLRLDHKGGIDWKYVFKDIDFDGSPSTIYPYWGNPSVRELEISATGEIFIVGSALNHLKLSENVSYQYAPITEGKHWRTWNPFIAALDSCGNPFWLESIKVNKEHHTDYLSICLHQDGDLSFSTQIRQDVEYTLRGEPIVNQNTNQLLFGRRKRPILTPGPCTDYEVVDTSYFALADPLLAALDSPTPAPLNSDSLPPTEPAASPPQALEKPCLSALLLFPNPNQGNFNLQWEVKEAQEFVIRLTDMQGQVLRTEKRRYPPGIARMQFIGLGLAQGMYIASISCTSDMQSIRFVVGGNGIPMR